MPYVVENLVQYDLTEQEAAILEAFGLLFTPTDEHPDAPDMRETTALTWNDLGLEGDAAFLLFDVILGREGSE